VRYIPDEIIRGHHLTEAEWLACTDLAAMLDFLRYRATERQFRLFACACCRAIWPSLDRESSRTAVAVAEAFADDQVGRKELKAARKAAGQFTQPPPGQAAAYVVANAEGWSSARGILEYVTAVTASPEEWASPAEAHAAQPRFAQLLREVIGNPFRPPVVDPTWLLWHDGTVRHLARAIYDDRTYEQLPILADALEEAGCTDADILAHCRGPGPHVRGCWAVDAILGTA
jgi:hypothetical protein